MNIYIIKRSNSFSWISWPARKYRSALRRSTSRLFHISPIRTLLYWTRSWKHIRRYFCFAYLKCGLKNDTIFEKFRSNFMRDDWPSLLINSRSLLAYVGPVRDQLRPEARLVRVVGEADAEDVAWARFIGGIFPDGWVVSDETSKHFHRKFAKILSNFHKISQHSANLW